MHRVAAGQAGRPAARRGRASLAVCSVQDGMGVCIAGTLSDDLLSRLTTAACYGPLRLIASGLRLRLRSAGYGIGVPRAPPAPRPNPATCGPHGSWPTEMPFWRRSRLRWISPWRSCPGCCAGNTVPPSRPARSGASSTGTPWRSKNSARQRAGEARRRRMAINLVRRSA